MTVITNKVFVDSSILIESEKGNFSDFLHDLYFDPSIQLCINDIVLSEFLFHFIGLQSGKAPLTIKEKKAISAIIEIYSEDELLKNFEFIPSSKEIITLVPVLMAKYNLLPNDAIIIANLKINNISMLASHDTDFAQPCAGEGITLLTPEKI
ncbi:MAG: type II toxin-antitoxin system VapC family toxin [Ferruginibacter sp.]